MAKRRQKRSSPLLAIDVFTLFPKAFKSPLGESIIKIAREKKLVSIALHDLRRYADDRHRTCDDKPFGGGPGMVMKPEPIFRAFEDVLDPGVHTIYLTPEGRPFSQARAHTLSEMGRFALLCGHYEGVDERVRTEIIDEEISVGDFVMSGGEIPALCLIDAVTRLVPGVLGNASSLEDESFHNERLDYPHYTRPRMYRGLSVPEVLVSGDHAAVLAWRRREALERTRRRRPDLLQSQSAST